MILKKQILLVVILYSCALASRAQVVDSLIRVKASFETILEEQFPGAVVFSKSDGKQVYIEHRGIKMWCDYAIYYRKTNFIKASGSVRMNQGDTIFLDSNKAEYDGNSRLAYATGDVNMRSPESTLASDKLFFNRATQEAYYRTGGTVRDTESVLSSRVGRYFMTQKKYEFLDKVVVTNPKYIIESNHLNFYSDSGHAYMYGPSTITGKTSKVYSERGFYNTRADEGHFVLNSKIDYDNRTITGDSLFYNRVRNFASATNNITVLDTLNKSVITGHYAEVFKDKDSVFITKRAVATSIQDGDSVYVHADTLMVTGPKDDRILRGFREVRLFKKDLSGKSDSIYTREATGLTKMIRKPILWSGANQITGDTIHLQNNVETQKIDSLRVFYNAFMVHKDSIDGFNQLKGRQLLGYFNDNELSEVRIIKNVENLLYVRDDETSDLIGINTGTAGRMEIFFEDRAILKIVQLQDPQNVLNIPEEFPENVRLLRDFMYRGDEQLLSKKDLFKDKPLPTLTKIKGIPLPVLEKPFFDETTGKPNENGTLKPEDLKIKDGDKLENITGTGN
jgi:lipopolysaccharide export system protein LptA